MITPIIRECIVCGNKKISNDLYKADKCEMCGNKMKIITGEAQATLS